MRALVTALVCSPALAIAQPAVSVDVDVRIGEHPPSSVEPVAPPAPPAPPARWFSVGGTLGVANHDDVSNDASDPSHGARIEVDLVANDSWRAGLAFGRAKDKRFRDGYDYYDGAALTDTRVVAYLVHAARRGRFEGRVGGGLGVVNSSVHRWSSRYESGPAGNDVTAIVEASAQVSVDIVGPLALGIGTVITYFDQELDSWTYDRDRYLHRGVDVSLQSALRWKL